MASISPECTKFKHEYDTCFNKWYMDKFLKGNSSEDDCKELFNTYRTCVWSAIKERKLDELISKAQSENPFKKLEQEENGESL